MGSGCAFLVYGWDLVGLDEGFSSCVLALGNSYGSCLRRIQTLSDRYSSKFQASDPSTKPRKRVLIASKLQAIIERKYLVPGRVESLIQFFDVPKADDIRLVHNGRSCGLNAFTWAPNFWLPTTKSAIRLLDFNYYSVDLDLGKCFSTSLCTNLCSGIRGLTLLPTKVN
jgi:hypothetical protein